MLLLSHYEVLGCLLPTLVISLAFAPQSPDGSLTLINPSSLPDPLNGSSQNGVTNLTAPAVYCYPDIYGEVDLDSCKDAFNQIPHDVTRLVDKRILSYGPRDHGSWDFILPKRFISCEPLFNPRIDFVASCICLRLMLG